MAREVNPEMMKAAKDRAEVYVEHDDRPRRYAILVAWEPMRKSGKRQWGRARVQYASGNCATVDTSRITLINKPAEEVVS